MNRPTLDAPRRPHRPAGRPLPLRARILLLPLLAAGCTPTATPSDPAAGREALAAALDAWKAGESPEALAGRNPPIHVADEDWEAGRTLSAYSADDPGRLVGGDVQYAVALEFKSPKGATIRKDAVYAVTTNPQILVLRQDAP